MDLTISPSILHTHAAHRRVLWYHDDDDGSVYWAIARSSLQDMWVLDPGELLPLTADDGSETTIRIEVVSFNAPNNAAVSTWLDHSVDVVAMRRDGGLCAYGRLHDGIVRRWPSRPISLVGMACPTADERWIVWNKEEGRPLVVDDWAGVVRTVGA